MWYNKKPILALAPMADPKPLAYARVQGKHDRFIMWYNKKPILALAPMADMTDSPFCRVCREVAGEDFVIFREMVSAEAIVRNNEKTLKMCEFDPIESPIVLQLFGSNPEVIVRAACIIKERFLTPTGIRNELFGIDINMGCPVSKITGKSNSGATLMRDHARAVEIVKALKNANLGVPVSVKTRLGWAKDDEILEFAPKLEDAGVDAISIHGRTKKQGYSGKANWERIGEVKKLLKIPVIANGDINSEEDIKNCLEITGADGVMIGRGALGNPWVLSRYMDPPAMLCKALRAGNPDIQIVKDVVLRHAELHLACYGEEYGLKTFRKHLALYFKGMPGMKELRMQLVKISSLDDLKKVLRKIR